MFAIIQSLGRQYRVTQGDLIKVDHLKDDKDSEVKPGTRIAFTQVLALGNDTGTLQMGKPFLTGVAVEAEVVEHGKEKKIHSFKMKRRKGFKKKIGSRREYSVLKINEIKAA